MDELKKALEEGILEPVGFAHDQPLMETAGRWAVYALQTYRGELLKAALDVSRSISEFCLELEGKGSGSE